MTIRFLTKTSLQKNSPISNTFSSTILHQYHNPFQLLDYCTKSEILWLHKNIARLPFSLSDQNHKTNVIIDFKIKTLNEIELLRIFPPYLLNNILLFNPAMHSKLFWIIYKNDVCNILYGQNHFLVFKVRFQLIKVCRDANSQQIIRSFV